LEPARQWAEAQRRSVFSQEYLNACRFANAGAGPAFVRGASRGEAAAWSASRKTKQPDRERRDLERCAAGALEILDVEMDCRRPA
jgi:hypothetical protein